MAELGLRKREGVGWVGARLARTVLEFCVFFMKSQNRESVIMNCCTGIMNCCIGTTAPPVWQRATVRKSAAAVR